MSELRCCLKEKEEDGNNSKKGHILKGLEGDICTCEFDHGNKNPFFPALFCVYQRQKISNARQKFVSVVRPFFYSRRLIQNR